MTALLLLSGCEDGSPRAPADLEKFVAKGKIGSDADQWIEMQNHDGEWERVGLVFGYYGDAEECEKAIAGLKKVNYAREYRCSQANI